jgi:molybdopterin molybdotransferase
MTKDGVAVSRGDCGRSSDSSSSDSILSYADALNQVLENAHALSSVDRGLREILGYVLAKPVVARFAMPQFDNSAVDGLGVLIEDLQAASEQNPVSLKLSGEIQAGARGELSLAKGCAIKILTGAVVPPTVQAVVMREYCREENGCVVVGYLPSDGENIRRRGGEFSEGTEVLPSGLRVIPPVVGLLASLGYTSFPVHHKPRIALVATGDELVEPGHELLPGQIYNSNAYALAAALNALRLDEVASLHAADTPESTRKAFFQALNESDVVISTGGVSVGDHDYVKEALEQLGVQTVFWRIAIKPGKPVYFGIKESEGSGGHRKLVFGLPGNPVSSLVTFHQFVKPALLKMMGCVSPNRHQVSATLTSPLKKKPGRLDFVRAMTGFNQSQNAMQAAPTRGQDSHMISGLAKANSLIHFGADESEIENNSQVLVDLLDWWD